MVSSDRGIGRFKLLRTIERLESGITIFRPNITLQFSAFHQQAPHVVTVGPTDKDESLEPTCQIMWRFLQSCTLLARLSNTT